MMNAIKIKKTISGNIIEIDELKQFKGKVVNIIIFPENTHENSSSSKRKIPSWVGKYSSEGNLNDDRINIYQ
jgi:hypothetical protein